MPLVDIYDFERNKVGEMELPDDIFGVESKPHLYYDVIRAQLLSHRRGTVCTKDRSMVSGSTRKIYRQKGTGRARHGDDKSPIFRRGGVVFGPKPRDWEIKIPKKVKRAALLSALSDRVREGHFVVLNEITLPKPHTKDIARFLKQFEINSVLFVDEENEELSLSCRNIPTAKYLNVAGLNLFDILKYDHLVITKRAVEMIEGRMRQ